jgi:hypothetical protein
MYPNKAGTIIINQELANESSQKTHKKLKVIGHLCRKGLDGLFSVGEVTF